MRRVATVLVSDKLDPSSKQRFRSLVALAAEQCEALLTSATGTVLAMPNGEMKPGAATDG